MFGRQEIAVTWPEGPQDYIVAYTRWSVVHTKNVFATDVDDALRKFRMFRPESFNVVRWVCTKP